MTGQPGVCRAGRRGRRPPPTQNLLQRVGLQSGSEWGWTPWTEPEEPAWCGCGQLPWTGGAEEGSEGDTPCPFLLEACGVRQAALQGAPESGSGRPGCSTRRSPRGDTRDCQGSRPGVCGAPVPSAVSAPGSRQQLSPGLLSQRPPAWPALVTCRCSVSPDCRLTTVPFLRGDSDAISGPSHRAGSRLHFLPRQTGKTPIFALPRGVTQCQACSVFLCALG